jgi:CRP-like cAMP-binding protein
MNDGIDKQNSIISHIIDGSVTIDSVAEFENLLKAVPNDPGLHRVFADLLKKEKSSEAAADEYGNAAKLFIKAGSMLHAIVSKSLEWQIFKPSGQEEQTFYSSLCKIGSKDTAIQDFFIKMTRPEMMIFMNSLALQFFPAEKTIKKFGDEENHLYFVVSGALEENIYHRLKKTEKAQKKSARNLLENDFFGEIYPFEETKLSQSDIETTTRVELAKVSKSSLIAICRKYPNIKLLVEGLYEPRFVYDEEAPSRIVRKTARSQLPTQLNLKIFRDEPGKTSLNIAGFAENISMGGACVVLGPKYKTGHPGNLTGSRVKVKIGLPIAAVNLFILGTIVWSKAVSIEGKTMIVVGIQFEEMTETDRKLLKDYHYGSEGEQNLIWTLWDIFMEK